MVVPVAVAVVGRWEERHVSKHL